MEPLIFDVCIFYQIESYIVDCDSYIDENKKWESVWNMCVRERVKRDQYAAGDWLSANWTELLMSP